jgi:replicative DNA helicase
MEDLSIRAEQAMLGAVLCDPAGQCHLLELVEAEDMRRPWHAQVLAAMRRVRARKQLPGPMQVYAELQKDPDLPQTVARDGVPVAELMAAAPNPRYGESYACQVIEGGIRRRLDLAGSRLSQAAETGDLAAALRQATEAGWELTRCINRWLALPERLRREIPKELWRKGQTVGPTPPARMETPSLRRDLPNGIRAESGDRLVRLTPAAPGPPAARAHQEEPQTGHREIGQARHTVTAELVGGRALRDLAAAPSCLSEVGEWLRPEHFARAKDGQLYAVMRDLNAAGKPVDPVTIAWEAARRGLDADPAGLAHGSGPFAIAGAREVHRHSMLAQAGQAGRDIQADAANPACSPQQLLASTRARLRALDKEAQRQAQPGREARVITVADREPTS